MRRRLLVPVAVAMLTLAPAPAFADWLVSPFVGLRFGAETTLLFDLEQGTEHRKFLWGASFALLSDRVLGVEADFSYVPGFFEGAPGMNLIAASRAITLTGNVLIAAPLSVTGLGLRPYIVGGAGLLDARSRGHAPGDVLPIDSSYLALSLGGGAIGPLTPRSSVRFDVRQFRSLTRDEAAVVRRAGTQLSFWRATVGLTLRY